MSPTPARSSAARLSRATSAAVRPVTGITSVETPASRARSSAPASARSLITSATRATSDAGPAKWSRIACRFVPPPDAKTAILMARSAASGKASPIDRDEERVRDPLVGDRRLRPVARVQDRVVRERQDLLPDRAHELLEVAAREIGPADRALEHDIAHEGNARVRHVEDHVPRRMARRMPHLDPEPAELERLTVDEFTVGRRRRLDPHPKEERLLRSTPVQRPVRRVQVNRRAGPRDQLRDAFHVIHVRVREEDRLQLEPLGVQERRHRRGLAARIDHDRTALVPPPDHVRVLAEPRRRECTDLDHPTLHSSSAPRTLSAFGWPRAANTIFPPLSTR